MSKKNKKKSNPNLSKYWIGKTFTFSEQCIQGDAEDWNMDENDFEENISDNFDRMAKFLSVEIPVDDTVDTDYFNIELSNGFTTNFNFYQLPDEVEMAIEKYEKKQNKKPF